MSPPSVYLFYGDNPLAISETIKDLEAKLGPSGEFNVQHFSGASLDIDQLRVASGALPFLSDRRLIVVENAERIPATETDSVTLLLNELPETAAVVFVEQAPPPKPWGKEKISFLRQWASEHPEKAYMRAFFNPTGAAFVHWLSERSEGQIELDAAQLLSYYVEEDPQLAEQELQKLLNYVNGERPISVEDVERLSPTYGELHIFDVVDKLGDAEGSLARLQRVLEEQDPRYVFPMVVRQFRLMILARRAIEIGEDPIAAINLPGAKKLPGSAAKNIKAKSQQFTTSQLKDIYQQLLELDISVKRGEADLSLDLLPLIASLS